MCQYQNVVGQNLVIESLAPDGKTMQFKVDSSGAFLNNSQFLVQSDNGGQVAIDPAFGLAIGGGVNKPLYSFDDKGKIQLNKENAKLYTDLNGNLHSIGNIFSDGELHGSKITASEVYIGGKNTAADCKFGVDRAGNILGLETQNGKIKFDANGNATFDNDVNISGNLNMTGNINWSPNSFPVKSQFSVNGTSGWHDTYASADKYRRDTIFDGSWGKPYPITGKDGTNGSDASVNYDNIKAALNRASNAAITVIGGSSIDTADIYANNIYGGKFYAGDGEQTYVSILENGLEIYSEGVDESKMQLKVSEGGKRMELILGAGDESKNNRGSIVKTETWMQVVYIGESGVPSGIMLKDGTVQFMGKVLGDFPAKFS